MNELVREGQPCTNGACAGGARELEEMERTAFGPAIPDRDRGIPCSGMLPEPNLTRTNPKYLFLREIGEVGNGACLKAFLEQVSASGKEGLHWGATLIIDQLVSVPEPITIPSDFTLAGVGTNGGGGLLIPLVLTDKGKSLPTNSAAILFASGGNSVLRDLRIEGANSDAAGILIRANTGPIYIDGVRVFGLRTGLIGEDATSVYISNCTFDACQTENITLKGGCRHWRIRDSDIRFAGFSGIRIEGPGAEDTLIHGCQFESDGRSFLPMAVGAINAQGCFGTFIFGSRFESNGRWPILMTCFRTAKTLEVDPHGIATRFLCNFTSSDQPRPGDFIEVDAMKKPTWPRLGDAVQRIALLTQTHIGFNCSTDWGTQGLVPPFPMNQINAPENAPNE